MIYIVGIIILLTIVLLYIDFKRYKLEGFVSEHPNVPSHLKKKEHVIEKDEKKVKKVILSEDELIENIKELNKKIQKDEKENRKKQYNREHRREHNREHRREHRREHNREHRREHNREHDREDRRERDREDNIIYKNGQKYVCDAEKIKIKETEDQNNENTMIKIKVKEDIPDMTEYIHISHIPEIIRRSRPMDMDKYILKSEIPPCPTNPDPNRYILKSQIPPCPIDIDHNKYILKSQIPPCKECPNSDKYILKSSLKRNNNNIHRRQFRQDDYPVEHDYKSIVNNEKIIPRDNHHIRNHFNNNRCQFCNRKHPQSKNCNLFHDIVKNSVAGNGHRNGGCSSVYGPYM